MCMASSPVVLCTLDMACAELLHHLISYHGRLSDMNNCRAHACMNANCKRRSLFEPTAIFHSSYFHTFSPVCWAVSSTPSRNVLQALFSSVIPLPAIDPDVSSSKIVSSGIFAKRLQRASNFTHARYLTIATDIRPDIRDPHAERRLRLVTVHVGTRSCETECLSSVQGLEHCLHCTSIMTRQMKNEAVQYYHCIHSFSSVGQAIHFITSTDINE